MKVPPEAFGPKSPMLKNTIGVIKEALAKKPKAPSSHPPYNEMIKRAIDSCKENASRRNILEYLMSHYDVGQNETVVNNRLKFSLRVGLKTGFLDQKARGPGNSVVFKIGAGKRVKPASADKRKKTPKSKSSKGRSRSRSGTSSSRRRTSGSKKSSKRSSGARRSRK
jgi:histone H1/5